MSLRDLFTNGDVKQIPSVNAAAAGDVLTVQASTISGVNYLTWAAGGGPGDLTSVQGTTGEVAVSTVGGVATVSLPAAINLQAAGQTLAVSSTVTGVGAELDTVRGLAVKTGLATEYSFPITQPTLNQVMIPSGADITRLIWYNVPSITGSTATVNLTLSLGSASVNIPVQLVMMGAAKLMIMDFSALYNNPLQNLSGGTTVQFSTNAVTWPAGGYASQYSAAMTLGHCWYQSSQNTPFDGTTAYGMCAVGLYSGGTNFSIQFTLCPSMWGTSGIPNTTDTYGLAQDKFLTLSSIPNSYDADFGIKSMNAHIAFAYY